MSKKDYRKEYYAKRRKRVENKKQVALAEFWIFFIGFVLIMSIFINH